MTSAWGRLGTMERISVGLPQLDISPSATSTASLNNMASTSSHVQGTGYGCFKMWLIDYVHFITSDVTEEIL